MKKQSPLKSIRAKCLDCMCWSSNEVKLCPSEDCPLFMYRFGKNPARRGISRLKPVVSQNKQ